jgi:NAD+ synthase
MEERDISPMIDAYFAGDPKAGRVRRGNKMARERMSILYDRSAAHEALVLGTSNKSELLLGYGTIHGDMASSINPLGDLYKTQVFQLARHLRIPATIQRKVPTADLWPEQTDEKDLGAAYADLDQILHLLIDERWTRSETIHGGWPPRLVDRVLARVRGSQFKRRMPLIAKVSPRTVGIDFRYPRDWGT